MAWEDAINLRNRGVSVDAMVRLADVDSGRETGLARRTAHTDKG